MFPFLLVIILTFAPIRMQRVALVTGKVTFKDTDRSGAITLINANRTIVVPHAYQASTALSLISLTHNYTSAPFTNFASTITVVETSTQDTITIGITAATLANITAFSYQIDMQYLRVASFPTY